MFSQEDWRKFPWHSPAPEERQQAEHIPLYISATDGL
jgi:hypothetical protein